MIFTYNVILSIHLLIGYNGFDRSNHVANYVISVAGKDRLDTAKNTSSNKDKVTITVSYAAIACGCPQWFETKFIKVPFLKGVEHFYLEPTNKRLKNANDLWDGENLPLTLKLTGRFSEVEEAPKTYHVKGEPEKARIFWYDKITVVSAKPKH